MLGRIASFFLGALLCTAASALSPFVSTHDAAVGDGISETPVSLQELVKAVHVLTQAGVKMDNVDWGRHVVPPAESFLETSIIVHTMGLDFENVSKEELCFFQDALEWSYRQVNGGSDYTLYNSHFVQSSSDGGDGGGGTASMLRKSRYVWNGFYGSMGCRFCGKGGRDDNDRLWDMHSELLGTGPGGPGLKAQSPLIEAWQEEFKKTLKASRFTVFDAIEDLWITVEVPMGPPTTASRF